MLRPVELDRFKTTWITQKAYEILRNQKKEQKKSIIRLIEEAIIKAYETQ